MAGVILKFFGAVASLGVTTYFCKEFTSSQKSDLAKRTNKVAQTRKPQDPPLLQLQEVRAKEQSGLRQYYDPLSGERIKSSFGPQPIFEKDDQGFHFLGTTDALSPDSALALSAGDYTCASSVIVPTESKTSNKYALVNPLIVGTNHHCQKKALQEALIKDAVALAVQGQLDPVYNEPIYQCEKETANMYARCTNVGELTRMSDNVKAVILSGKFTVCHFRSLDEPVARKAAYTGTSAVLLDLDSSHTCDDFLSGKLRHRKPI